MIHPLHARGYTAPVLPKQTVRFANASKPDPHAITLLPEEIAISEYILESYDAFQARYDAIQSRPHPKDTLNGIYIQFIDGVHWMQQGLGSIRFWHYLNAHDDPNGAECQKRFQPCFEKIGPWFDEFQQTVADRQYPDEWQAVMTPLLEAWPIVMELSERYPYQHCFDSFADGMAIVDEMTHALLELSKSTVSETQ